MKWWRQTVHFASYLYHTVEYCSTEEGIGESIDCIQLDYEVTSYDEQEAKFTEVRLSSHMHKVAIHG